MELPRIKRILFDEKTIKERIAVLGGEISRDFLGRDLILVGVLKGSLFFLSDLARAMDIPVRIDLMSVGVYPNSVNQSGIVRINKDMDLDINGRDVLIVEDAVRTGLTIGYLVQNLMTRMPQSVRVCSLIVDPKQLLIDLPIAYTGFEVSAEYIIGYGSDIRGKWRNLPYIAELDKDEYIKAKG